DVAKTDGFVSLGSVKAGGRRPSGADALSAIRHIYFKTTKRTIEHDLAHAIDLLTGLDSEDEREKAAVYMDGLAQMRSEWAAEKRTATAAPRPAGRRPKS
ncbi:MAG: hypothetical protein HOP14_12690, partial [Acidobacteria bacterium]|nr:hypothetical protein [Acidobacteriota bacterium]